MPEFSVLLIIVATFALAGLVKGVVGLGLPSVSLGILAAAIDLPTAMALLLVPSFVTNAWQGWVGGNGSRIVRRVWHFLALATIAVGLGGWLATQLPAELQGRTLSGLLGFLLAIYGVVGLTGARLHIAPSTEPWAGPLVGAVNGVFTGLTGSFVVPGVMYLQALGLARDELVQAMGILFTLSTVALALTLSSNQGLSRELATLSTASVLPALLGMVLGQRIRQRIDEQRFRQVFFGALLALGTYIVLNALIASG